MDRITELRGRRVELAQKAEAFRNKSERSAEETQEYDKVINQIIDVDGEIEREERYLQSESRDADYLRRHPGVQRAAADAEQRGGGGGTATATGLVTLRSRGPQPDETRFRPLQDLQAQVDPGFRSWMQELYNPEVRGSNYSLRAFQVDDDPQGGFLVRPEQFVARLIQAVDNNVFVRQMATVYQVADSTSMGAPSLDTDAADADWTIELGTGNEETTMRFGKRSLTPHPLAKRVKISKTLLRLAALGAEQIVLDRLAYKFGITQEKAFLLGTGVQQPLGVFTASADGISTGRDVSTGNTSTSILFDGLIEAKYTLKPQYWGKVAWMFHRDGVKQIAKLKDGDGQYIWRQSIIAGEPDTILNFPVIMSEYVPNTFTSGLYVGILGDFSNYWIADSLAMEMQRLVELYAETNQIGFIGRLETDGMPVLEEAFVRVKLG